MNLERPAQVSDIKTDEDTDEEEMPNKRPVEKEEK